MIKYIILAASIFSCRSDYNFKNPYTYLKPKQEYFASYVNKSTQSISLINHSYPIQLSLRADQRFTYKLEVLGEGEGTWTFKDGMLQLYAERDLFVMNMSLNQAEGLEHPILEFKDRFGPNYLEMDVQN